MPSNSEPGGTGPGAVPGIRGELADDIGAVGATTEEARVLGMTVLEAGAAEGGNVPAGTMILDVGGAGDPAGNAGASELDPNVAPIGGPGVTTVEIGGLL